MLAPKGHLNEARVGGARGTLVRRSERVGGGSGALERRGDDEVKGHLRSGGDEVEIQ